MLNEALQNVTVIGASGKMGSGIALLLLQEMTRLDLEQGFKEVASQKQLNLVDRNQEALDGLKAYLSKQLTRYAEKVLKADAALTDLFVQKGLTIANFTLELESAKNSKMVFEAIFERLDIKTKLLLDLKEICSEETNFFSNTSSIPISVVEKEAGVEGRLIGFHFYNPPAVQKLVELISSDSTPQALQDMSMELGQRLRKVMVPSNDIAGFIGNGHFIRDGLYAISQIEELSKKVEPNEALYQINRITQDFMVRPMGIFQLIDYVGLDVFQMILNTMNTYIEDEELSSDMINMMIDQGVSGGQFHDGSQKDGFLKYENHKPVATYSLKEKKYIRFDEGDWTEKCDQELGNFSEKHFPWKALSRDAEKDVKLSTYFQSLFEMDSKGAKLAQAYLLNSKKISENLVKNSVAAHSEDVGKVLMNGFFHLYAPENEMY
ncbi:MAG: 3-hydroxybutyryl-CoA dehydrogenase [SAR324 cluster bacterium]|uniref:3-hydroxybutyryl-CoA dehydrogenase n=1 Tax=SAR324 cluster bacterium TaxID=2024889 RepID=A0A2A4T6H5_9DELT|nr:MAG: 3-hydroxybutyryl-CoA dehydrogenase [SAR324 cluster bacterium]